MDVISLALAKNHTNEQLNKLNPTLPTKAVSFDNGIYSVPSDIVNGQISDCVIKGLTIAQNIQNGNVSTSVTSSATGERVALNPDGTWTIATPYSATRQTFDIITGNKYFVKWKLKSTSIGLTDGRVGLLYSDGTIDIAGDTNPLTNKVGSVIITATKTLKANIVLVSSATTGLIEREYQMLINLTAHGLDGLTIDQLNSKLPNYISTGAKSTLNARLKSKGGNLDSQSIITASDSTTVFGDKCRIDPTKAIYVKQNINALHRVTFKFFDSAGNEIISGLTLPNYGGTGFFYSNGRWISGADVTAQNTLITIAANQGIFYVQVGLFKAATATDRLVSQIIQTYEPYKESTIQIPEVGRSLLNGTKDEVNATLGQKVQRVKSKVLVDADFEAMLTTLTNVDAIYTKQFTDNMTFTSGIDNFIDVFGKQQILNSSRNDVAHIGKYYTDPSNRLYFIVAKGTSFADAKTSLLNQALIYQLATPITTKIPQQPPLQIFENGTVYVEPIGDVTQTTLPSITANLPIGDNNKFGVAVHDYQAANADWVLTTNEQKCMILVVSNSGANANIILPNVAGRVYMVKNATAYNVVCKSAGAEAGTTILPGNSGIVFNGGV